MFLFLFFCIKIWYRGYFIVYHRTIFSTGIDRRIDEYDDYRRIYWLINCWTRSVFGLVQKFEVKIENDRLTIQNSSKNDVNENQINKWNFEVQDGSWALFFPQKFQWRHAPIFYYNGIVNFSKVKFGFARIFEQFGLVRFQIKKNYEFCSVRVRINLKNQSS